MKGGLMFGMKPRNKRHPMPSERKQKQKAGWGAISHILPDPSNYSAG